MPRKGENIRKRKDGRWEGRYKKGYNQNGKILYGSIYGKSYREVKEKMLQVLNNLSVPDSRNFDKAVTFGELLSRWQAANEIRLKGGTKSKYAHLISCHIEPELGACKLDEITTQKVNAFLSDRLNHGRKDGKGGLSASYIRSMALIITSSMRFAADEGLCQPINAAICKPNIIKKELTILSHEEQRVLEQSIRNHPFCTEIGILISLYTGLRIGEVCALAWEDVDFLSNTLYVRHTVSRVKSQDNKQKTILILDEPKTQSSKRIVPMPSPLCSLLFEYRKHAQSPYVVSDKSSFISPRTYEERFHKVLHRCQIRDLNYHTLRHTFATRCIEAGVDVKSLSEILGHSNISITLNTYVHSSLEMKKIQLEKLTFLALE